MNNISFGRYVPNRTFIHRLDPRNKLFLLILLMVMIFLQFTTWSATLLLSGVYLMLLIGIMLMSKVSFIELFKSLKAMWFFIIFLMIIYILLPNPSYHMLCFSINGFKVYWDAFYQCGYILLRLILMISLTMVLTSSTKPMDLTYAFEWYMTPFKVVKFPVHEISMTLSIALRFIPTLLDETERIMKAQASRGVDFSHGKLAKRFKAIISLIVPLFVSSIESSEELSNAMEARGYDPKAKRSRYRQLSFSYRDLIAFLFTILLFAGVLFLFIYDKKVETLDLFKILFNVELGF